MRIAVVGASGGTGIEVVRHAVARGDDVTAVVRNVEKFVAAWPGRPRDVRVELAEGRDVEALARAFEANDAVVFCLGPVNTSVQTIQREGIRACLAAMELAGVNRLVAVSNSGMVVQGDDPLTRYVVKPVIRRLLAGPWQDMMAMEVEISDSSFEWTVIRPPRLTNQPGSGHYRSRRTGNVTGRSFMSRANLGLSIVDALHDDSSIGQKISVSN